MFTIIAMRIFSIWYSARSARSDVKLPGPASNGNAKGKTETVFALTSSSSLNILTPKIISNARKNRIKDPATANSFTLTPMTPRMLSPINTKAIIITSATIDAFALWICPAFLRSLITIGILPTISITANKIMVAAVISLISKFIQIGIHEMSGKITINYMILGV